MHDVAIQDRLHDNFCWGCGADNPDGLHLKSYWDGRVAVATFVPADMFAAGPRHVLNGGIVATLLDCHGVCTAIAQAYDVEERAIGTDPDIWHATTSIEVAYLRPTPLGQELELRGQVLDAAADPGAGERVSSVECVLSCGGKERARATVRSVRVPEAWRHGLR